MRYGYREMKAMRRRKIDKEEYRKRRETDKCKRVLKKDRQKERKTGKERGRQTPCTLHL